MLQIYRRVAIKRRDHGFTVQATSSDNHEAGDFDQRADTYLAFSTLRSLVKWLERQNYEPEQKRPRS